MTGFLDFLLRYWPFKNIYILMLQHWRISLILKESFTHVSISTYIAISISICPDAYTYMWMHMHISVAWTGHKEKQFYLCKIIFSSSFYPPNYLGLISLAHSSSLSMSLWIASLPSSKSTAQLGAICKIAEGAFNFTVHIINRDTEQYLSQYRSPKDTTCCWFLTGL